MTNKIKYLLVVLGLIIICGAVYWGIKNKVWEEQYSPLEFSLVDRGNYGVYSELLEEDMEKAGMFSVFVIENQADWKNFWPDYIRNPNTGGFAYEPDVDFANKIVIVMLQGVKNSGGYYMMTNGVDLGSNSIKIDLGVFEPSGEDANTQVISSPYEIISIDRKDIIDSNKVIKIFNNNNGQLMLEKKVSDLVYKR